MKKLISFVGLATILCSTSCQPDYYHDPYNAEVVINHIGEHISRFREENLKLQLKIQELEKRVKSLEDLLLGEGLAD